MMEEKFGLGGMGDPKGFGRGTSPFCLGVSPDSGLG